MIGNAWFFDVIFTVVCWINFDQVSFKVGPLNAQYIVFESVDMIFKLVFVR